ncbi:MAG: ABC transporter substrate-binding protein [Chloroflexi bacterium]|nr:ABC transporter substrate-binding protein [Chloroflexota bacterium]MBU1751401.1 ABC transporter substrate-binding protein [Chloroflexota bacterium]MBU1879297.1 ABC transporter substrate-binding protein [Chloroflexota bacterium]
MKSPRNGIWFSLIVLVCLAMAATACLPEAATPTVPPSEPVSLQLQWVTQAQFAGYYVALDKGWYREEGIDLTIMPGGPDITPVDLVSAGTRDFGTTLLADLTVSVQKGTPVVSIGQIQQKNGLLLIAKKTSGVTGPQDFKGKRVGVWLGSWQAQFDALIAQAGIPPNDFDLVAQGWSMDPFLAGELDVASAMIYNEYHVVLESGVKTEDMNVIDYANYGLDFPGDTLFTSRKMVEQKPDLCVRMLRASLRGWQYAIDHPAEAADIVLKYDESKVQTREHQLSMMVEIAKLVQMEGRSLGRTDEAAIKRTIDTLLQYKILSGPVESTNVYTNDFWDQARTPTP